MALYPGRLPTHYLPKQEYVSVDQISTVDLVCADCGEDFTSPKRRGGKPTRCGDCKVKSKRARAVKDNKLFRERRNAGGAPCAVDSCPRFAYCKGWCKNHYERWRRYGDVRTDIPLPEEYPTVCTVDGCDRGGVLRLGLCPAHRQRLERTGGTGTGILRAFTGFNEAGGTCLADGCDRGMLVRGWCNLHYSRWVKRGRVDAHLAPRGTSADGTCSIKSCIRPAPPGEWCNAHYYGWLEGSGLPPRFHNDVMTCVIDGCDQAPRSFGWCAMHTSRWVNHASTVPHIPVRRWGNVGSPCGEDGCRRPIIARGICRNHYARYRMEGQLGLRDEPSADEIERRLADRREYDRILSRAARLRDPERFRVKNLIYRRANPERAKRWDQAKRARRKSAPRIPYTPEQLQAKYAYWGDRCWMCGGQNDDLEHVKPLSKGGWDALANIRPACDPCNSRKWATWPYPRMTYGFMRAA